MIVGMEDIPPACFWELNNIGTAVFLVALAVDVNVKERIQKESLAGAKVQKVCRVGPWLLCMYGRGEVRGAAIAQRSKLVTILGCNRSGFMATTSVVQGTGSHTDKKG